MGPWDKRVQKLPPLDVDTYDYFDIENYQAAADEVKKLNDGELVFPLVRIGEDMLINPSRKELNDALVANGLLGSGENYGISK